MAGENGAEPRVSVNYRKGKRLDIGCAQYDCQSTGGSLAIRSNGDIVFENVANHDGHWHTNGKSLREMIAIIASHDLAALRDMLGPELLPQAQPVEPAKYYAVGWNEGLMPYLADRNLYTDSTRTLLLE